MKRNITSRMRSLDEMCEQMANEHKALVSSLLKNDDFRKWLKEVARRARVFNPVQVFNSDYVQGRMDSLRSLVLEIVMEADGGADWAKEFIEDENKQEEMA